MNSNDIFDMVGGTNKSYLKMKGFASAQSAHDNAEPEYDEIPETTQDEIDAHILYKCAIEMACASLRNNIEFLKKIKRNDCADLLENDLEELCTEVARREQRFV